MIGSSAELRGRMARRLLSAALGIALLGASDAAIAGMIEKQSKRGPVELTIRIEPDAPLIGDPIHLEIEALADEGVELLMPEFGEALDRFLILDFAPSEDIVEGGRTRALQRYTLQPPGSGPQSVPPLLVEFVDRREGAKPAPEGADAYELLTERIEFEVESVLPEGAVHELRPMPGALDPIGGGLVPVWMIVAAVALIAVAVGPFAYRAWAANQAKRRRRSAYQEAISELDQLLAWGSHPQNEQLEKFYVDLSGIIRRYLENRFNLRSPELTTEEFLDVASRSPDLSAGLRALLRDFLTQADLVKFAGFRPEPDQVDESIRAARRFLEDTRESSDDTSPTGAGEAER